MAQKFGDFFFRFLSLLLKAGLGKKTFNDLGMCLTGKLPEDSL